MEILPIQAKVNVDANVDLTPLSQATADVISAPTKGAGKILNALVGPWVANRDRAVAMIQAQTEKDCADIRNGKKEYRNGELLEYHNPPTLAGAYDALHTLNHMADARRLQSAIEQAIRQIAEVPPEEISDDPISQTFFNRWRREAEMIEEEDLRKWWSQLLVEEVKTPNSISPKTLDVMKDLSKSDIECFLRVCRGAIKGEVIVGVANNPVFGSYDDIVRLQDAGLVNSLEASVRIIPLHSQRQTIICFAGCDMGILPQSEDFSARSFSLTKAGQEVLRIVGALAVSPKDVHAIADLLRHNSLASGQVSVVRVPVDSSIDDWEWERGSRPACFS